MRGRKEFSRGEINIAGELKNFPPLASHRGPSGREFAVTEFPALRTGLGNSRAFGASEMWVLVGL